MARDKKKTTILYIDDSAFEREVVCNILGAEGCEVIATGSPEAGIELARGGVADLILLDLHMPDMDGYAVVEQLRGISALQSVPIVALSASIKEEERAEVDVKFDGFVCKPIDVDTFPAEVLELIARGRKKPSAPEDERGGEENNNAVVAAGDAEPALETLEKIRAALSHDLRSPLTVMISYAGTVGKGKAGDLSERQMEMLELVVDQGFKMDEMIAQLVRMARETLDRYGYP